MTRAGPCKRMQVGQTARGGRAAASQNFGMRHDVTDRRPRHLKHRDDLSCRRSEQSDLSAYGVGLKLHRLAPTDYGAGLKLYSLEPSQYGADLREYKAELKL